MVNAPEETTKPTVEVTEAATSSTEVPATDVAGSSKPAPTVESATELLNKGKRDLFCDNFTQAVDTLSEACSQFDEIYGEKNKLCANAYYLYGSALLELARMENGVLGNAMTGMPSSPGNAANDSKIGTEEISAEEEADISEKVSEALDDLAPKDASDEKTAETENDESDKVSEDKEVEDKTDADAKEGTSDEPKNDEASEGAETNDARTEKIEGNEVDEANDEQEEEKMEEGDDDQHAEDEDGDEVEGEEAERDEDDEDSLKLAWEMLEICRQTLDNSDLPDRDDMLSQCHLKLGQVLFESAHHNDAEKEFSKSIEMMMKMENKDERKIAEACFIAGLNLTSDKQFSTAANHFKQAIDVLQAKVEELEKALAKEGLKDEEKKEMEDEKSQLEELLPEMREKYQDSIASAKSPVKSLKDEMKDQNAAGSSSSCSSSAAAPVSDISHLVKRKSPAKNVLKENGSVNSTEDDVASKRKPEEAAPEESEAKKAKLDVNPDSTANPAVSEA